jgi:ECF sigma factor
MSQFAESGEFVFSFPLWVLVHESTVDDPSNFTKGLMAECAELRTLAAAQIAREKPGQTLQATGLVHEAYLRLVNVNHSDRSRGIGH